jgi:hypothetical protein
VTAYDDDAIPTTFAPEPTNDPENIDAVTALVTNSEFRSADDPDIITFLRVDMF